MLRLIAAAAILLAGGGMGMRRSQLVCLRRQALQDALLFLLRVQVRLQTGGGFWPEELTAAAADGGFGVLTFPTALPENLPPEKLSEWIVQKADAARLLADAAQPLCAALQCALTRTETLSRLEYYIRMLEQQLETARQREKQDKKLYCQLGWLGGALLAVILW